MELLYEGKTKDVYQLDEDYMLLQFKDDVTGEEGVFDPGANTVGLTMEGAGASGLRMTAFFYQMLNEAGIPTHYVDADVEKTTMTVKPAKVFGKGLEVICRYRAVGSFYRRYGAYCEEGQALDGFVEITLKDDEREDPPITKEALIALDILAAEEYEILKQRTKEVSKIVKDELAKKDLTLYDIKLEFGRDTKTNEILLIDEISGGNMRVFDEKDEHLSPLTLEKRVLHPHS